MGNRDFAYNFGRFFLLKLKIGINMIFTVKANHLPLFELFLLILINFLHQISEFLAYCCHLPPLAKSVPSVAPLLVLMGACVTDHRLGRYIKQIFDLNSGPTET